MEDLLRTMKQWMMFLIFFALLSPSLMRAQAPTIDNAKTIDTPEAKELRTPDKELVVIQTNLGTMRVQLFPKAAPKMVAHFKKLVREGFYNGTKFHRVIPNFMIQGGDVMSKQADKSKWGTGRANEETVPAEFHAELHHVPGIFSAARKPDPNSASTQFFVVVGNASWLDGQYTIFGEVADAASLEVAKKISELPRDPADHPVSDVVMQKVYIKAGEGAPAKGIRRGGPAGTKAPSAAKPNKTKK